MSEIAFVRQLLDNKRKEVKDIQEFKRRIDVIENDYNTLLNKHKVLLRDTNNDKIEEI